MNKSEVDQIKKYVMTRLKPGGGISIREVGGNIIIESKGGSVLGSVSKPETIEYVAQLPPVRNKKGSSAVFWCGPDTGIAILGVAGQGDDQVWTNVYPQQRWYARDKYTNKSGIPFYAEDDDDLFA